MAAINRLIKKIPRQKISDKVFEQVKDLITTGKLLPGHKIPGEMELTSLFDVSRSSVREAILKLECLGFVEQRRGDGTFVKSVTQVPIQNYMEEMFRDKQFLSGFMEVRNVLETWAAATAAARADQAEIDGMQNIVREMRKHQTGKIGYELNVRFHSRITAATHNPFLIHMMGSILSWLGTITDQIYTNTPKHLELQHQFTDQHQRIVTAIAAHNSDQAFEAMADHLDFAYKSARKNRIVDAPKGTIEE
jgi:GntR family transcriptional repressor for pyruvate dehydrogenase complex